MNARASRRYIDDLLSGQRPKPFRPDDFEAAQIRTVIDLRAARLGADAPRQEFLALAPHFIFRRNQQRFDPRPLVARLFHFDDSPVTSPVVSLIDTGNKGVAPRCLPPRSSVARQLDASLHCHCALQFQSALFLFKLAQAQEPRQHRFHGHRQPLYQR